ncbi:MAG: VWA-like domain-containing protein [Acidobacteriaceae bacterium]
MRGPAGRLRCSRPASVRASEADSGICGQGWRGTDFRPAIEALRRVPLDVAVYFTDLEGAFPEKKPTFPLLWAATQNLAVPFGRKLLLPAKGGL